MKHTNSNSAASAIAANTFLRSIAAAGFPLFARQMFNGMGIQWAGTLLGCFAFALVPIPVCFYLYGKKLRQKSRFAPTMRAPKPAEPESSDDDEPHGDMPALHSTKSRAHHDAPTMKRNGSTGLDGDVEKAGSST